MKNFENVIQPSFSEIVDGKFYLKGNWKKDFFKNDNPVVLEIGCGKGEYTVGLGKKFPNKNFIGIDIKGARIWYGAKDAIENNMDNVAFIRTKIELIESFFNKGEVDEIWITFPDPQQKNNRTKNRLTSSRFLKRYSNILSENGSVNLKTDSNFLYQYTSAVIDENNLEVKAKTSDLYNSELYDDILSIQTFYEQQFASRGIDIKYIKYALGDKTDFVEPDVDIEVDSYRSYGREKK